MESAPSSGLAGGGLLGGRAVSGGLVPCHRVPGGLAVDRGAGGRVAAGRRLIALVVRGGRRNLTTAGLAAGELAVGVLGRHRGLVARLRRVAEQITEQRTVVDHG